MRVVYDTSVLATILSRREEILRLQQAISRGHVKLVTSPFILNELETVLTKKFKLTKQEAKSRIHLLSRVSEVITPQFVEKIVRDINDDAIIATAVAGRADYLVTLDKDMLILKKHKDIIIITLAQFKELV